VNTAFERGRKPGVFTFTRTGDATFPLTVNYQLSGTATKWDDYRRQQGDMPEFVTIPARAASAALVIVPVDDKELEGPETVVLTISTNAAYNVGSPDRATITIQDNELRPHSSLGPDSDGDGLSDADEAVAGTDPHDARSVLKSISATRNPTTGSVTITWSSVPGKTYLVVCKDGLADPYWSDLSGPIAAMGTTTSWTDESASQSRWRIYCIVVS